MNIFPEDQVDENFFDLYYDPYKLQIWGVGFLIAVVTVSYLGVVQFRKSRLEDQWDRYNEARAIQPPLTRTPDSAIASREQVAAFRQIANDYPEDGVTPWALKGVVDAQVAAQEYDAALVSLDELEKRFPDFAMNSLPASPESYGSSLAAHLRASIVSEQEWSASTAYEHRWPSEERKACIETSDGTFWIGFYTDDAPEHVAAFVARAKAGKFNGTQVYQVRQAADGSPQLFRAGSAASKTERDPAAHDRDEALDTIEAEDSRYTIRHVKRVVSAVEMASGESATRFQVILANEMTRYNGQNTPFAAVLDQEDSLEAIEKIGRAETYSTNPETAEGTGAFRMRDNPYPSIYIRRVTILTNEKIEDGHTWDTARAHTSEPEPWEADRASDPKPEEFSAPAASDTTKPGDGKDDGDEKGDSENDEADDEAGEAEPNDADKESDAPATDDAEKEDPPTGDK